MRKFASKRPRIPQRKEERKPKGLFSRKFSSQQAGLMQEENPLLWALSPDVLARFYRPRRSRRGSFGARAR